MKKSSPIIVPRRQVEEENTTSTHEESLSYDEVIIRIRELCEEKVEAGLASNKKKIVGHRYAPYDWPVYDSSLLQFYRSKWALPTFLASFFSLYVIYLLFIMYDIVIAASVSAVIFSCAILPMGYLCYYPFRPKEQFYTIGYYAKTPNLEMRALLPTADDIKEMHKQAMSASIDYLATTIARQSITYVKSEIQVDIAIPTVYSYKNLHIAGDLNSVHVQ